MISSKSNSLTSEVFYLLETEITNDENKLTELFTKIKAKQAAYKTTTTPSDELYNSDLLTETEMLIKEASTIENKIHSKKSMKDLMGKIMAEQISLTVAIARRISDR